MVETMVTMEPIFRRLAELWQKQKCGDLTDQEAMDFTHCLNANLNYWWEMSYLENMSLLASMANNVDWQNEICIDIDKLEDKTKSPGSWRNTDDNR